MRSPLLTSRKTIGLLVMLVVAAAWSPRGHAEHRDRRARDASTHLQYDPAYLQMDLPVLPGTIIGTIEGEPKPVAPEKAAPQNTKAGVVAGDRNDLVSVMVHMHPALNRLAPQRSDVRKFATDKGGRVRYEYKVVLPNVLNLRDIPRTDIAALKQMPGVIKVEEDRYHPKLVKLDELTPHVRALQSQLSAAGLPYDGSGVRVCVADTGIDMDHIMYSSRIDTAASFDFHNNDSDPDDDNGHGSHVAGIAVGGTGLSVDFGCEGSEVFQGMAPGATLIGAKILNSGGGGFDSNIIAGIDHCADQSPTGGQADVINLSIGTGNFSSGACTHSWAVASNNAVANGVVVVAASGNENNANSMGSPACGVDVIAVGATYKDDYPNCEDGTSNFNWGVCVDSSPSRDQIVCFSNESDFLDVSAPGSVIQSASNAAGGSSIVGQSGTSMASPAVAGLAALVLDADPTLTPAQVRQHLRNGAIDLGPAGFDRAYGHGFIDAINTLNLITPCVVDGDCDDGQFCNGAETCNAGSCVAGTSPCGSDPCNESSDACLSLQTEWNMNSDPGWTTQGQWDWGSPTGGGGQHGGPDPTSGASGSNVMGYNLAGDYANGLAETHLTTQAINMSGLTNVTLRFQRWLGVEQPLYDHAYVRVSTNGSTYSTIWENTAEVADTSWSAQEFDISSIADNQSTVYIRWTMGTTDGSWQYCGWNIDDVQIYAAGGGPTCSDGVQNQGETRIDCGGPCPACNCTTDGACDNGAYCDGSETCDAFGDCQGGVAPNCDDGVACTDDSCNEGTDSCDNTTNDGNCDDGLYCNGGETCNAVSGCQAGSAPNCDDGVSCTTDSCNEGTDACDNVPSDGLCDDGAYCNGAETCNATLGCQSGTAVNCDDGVGCTDDSCNEGTDSCDNTANDGNCDDGLFCNGAETCNAVSDCQAGSDPCPGQNCDEGTDSCIDCVVDGDCDDGLFCNGSETCNAGSCLAGSAPNCDDGVGCTDDSCNEGTDSCDNTANDGNCDDGAYCNGAETCSGTLDCQAGTAVNCDDGVGCTDDSCNEGTDACDNTANDGNCDDGVFCNGSETCNAVSDCQAGTPPSCDDGVACTIDSCNGGTDSCDNTPDDGLCDDGLFCNGAETCDGSSCVSGSDPCPGQGCDEGADQCTVGPTAQLEAGSAGSVGGSAVTVNLAQSYVSPVVVCTINYVNNSAPVVARVSNVTSGSFDVRLENPSGAAVSAENVDYLVVEEGTWTIDGVNIEAQTYLSTVTDDASTNWFGEVQSYGQAYTAPVVLGQVMTENDSEWSVFWCHSGNRANPPTAAAIYTGKTVCEDSLTTRADETVGFIVIESGHGTIAGVEYEAALGSDTVLGTDNAAAYNYTFNTAFGSTPTVAIATMAAMDGNNGGWAYHAGNGLSSTTLPVVIDEDQIQDSERSHTSEQVGYAVFAGAVVYPAAPACTIDDDCDDGDYCNGAETCNAGNCVAGTAVSCDDGVACTDDSCNEATDSCDNVTNDGNCDDGAYCNGAETCDSIAGCQAGTAINCDDGVACTDDSCNEGTDSCDNTANDGNCDDGTYCNGAETCDSVAGCQAGSAVNCDDGVACTTDACNEGTDSCDNTPDNGACDDGLFCNGAETCDSGAGCLAGSDPCPGQTCVEATDTCVDCVIDGDCDDGLFCNGAETCSSGTCQSGSDPCPGQTCDEVGDQCISGPVAQMEAGTVVVGGSAVTVNLSNTYTSAVVVTNIHYVDNTTDVVTRVSSVGSSSFDVRIANPGGGAVVPDLVSYLVVEEGAWTIDGVNIEARAYTSTITDENNSWVGEAQTYQQSYTTPVVLGQVMTENDANWSVFWCQGTSRTNPPSAGALRTGKTVCEDSITARQDETVGFIVIEAGHGTIGGVEYEAALGADSVRGIGNNPPFNYSFNTAFGSAPEVALTTMAGVDGGNGGWSYLYGTGFSATTLPLAIDEDTINDSERNHTPEQVGYLVFGGAVSYP